MTRAETTEILTKLVESLVASKSGLCAKEVVFDYGSLDVRRVDVVAFYPKNDSLKGVESGDFVCYEVKSCKEDFRSGFGKNSEGDENYFVMTAQTYLDCKEELQGMKAFGVYVPVPNSMIAKVNNHKTAEWILNPEPFTENIGDWKLCKLVDCRFANRKRSNLQMMYLLLKANCHGR